MIAFGRERDLLRPLGAGIEQLEAEVPWAVIHELAGTLDDMLSRRMRLVQELPDRGASIATRVAELMGHELGWDAARQATEASTFLDTARVEFGVPGR